MDFYNLKDDWEKCKVLTIELEQNVENFIKRPISRKWCPILREDSKNIEKLGKKIKKNIIKQRQDCQSDYS